MTAIWRNTDNQWKLLAPTGFPDEKTLHGLVEDAPHLLPLAGEPGLVVVGREVPIGTGFADLVAIEPSGRLVLIEIKLAKNAEARRAVVAQVLAYAAYLAGTDATTIEQAILGPHLKQRSYQSLAAAVAASDQTRSFDAVAFAEGLSTSLSQGRFRLVFVLDEVPKELIRLVGYLQSISDKLVIDLIAIAPYVISDSMILVPQRVDPEREIPKSTSPPPGDPPGKLTDGADAFDAMIDRSPEQHRAELERLSTWAKTLESKRLAKLSTYVGKRMVTLLPRLPTQNAGLATIWNDNGASVSVWRSVFEKRAPKSLVALEALIKPVLVGQGSVLKSPSDSVLMALTDAYREAATG